MIITLQFCDKIVLSTQNSAQFNLLYQICFVEKGWNMIDNWLQNRTIMKVTKKAKNAQISMYRELIKVYKINYNPLLLPKLAVFGYQIKPDTSCMIFFSKIKLLDKGLITRENDFIKHINRLPITKEKLIQQEEKLFLLGNKSEERDLKSSKLQVEDRHRYSKILTNRLADLAEFIYHVQRLDKKKVIQERQCKQILQNEINFMNNLGIERKNSYYDQLKQKERNRKTQGDMKFFNYHQYQRKQRKNKNMSIQKLLDANLTERTKMHKKMNTESFDIISNLNNPTQFANEQLQKFSINYERLKDKQKLKARQSMMSIKESLSKRVIQSNSSPKRQSYLMKNSLKKVVLTEVNKIDEVAERSSILKHNKTTRYKFINSSKPQQRLGKPSKAHIDSAAIVQDNVQLIKQPQGLRKSKFQPKKKSKKSAVGNSHPSSLQQSSESEDISSISDVKIANEEQVKKEYLNKQRTKFRSGKMNKEMNFNINFEEDDLSPQVNKNAEKRVSILQNNKGQIPQQPNDIKLRSVAKYKRNGHLLGIGANHILERLVIDDGIQNMLQGEIHKKSEKQNKLGKYTTRQKHKKINTKHRISRKNKILMEVDIQADQKEQHLQLIQLKEEYVKNDGFNVQPKDMLTIRQNVKLDPYYHSYFANLYGGENYQAANDQFTTNQNGLLLFNRNFIQKIKGSKEEMNNERYIFLPDKSDNLRIELGKSLSRTYNSILQKQLQRQ